MQYSSCEMHKYVWLWVAVLVTFAATLPLAMMRVSQTQKFAGQPFNSLTCEGKIPPQRQVTKITVCTQLKASAIEAK